MSLPSSPSDPSPATRGERLLALLVDLTLILLALAPFYVLIAFLALGGGRIPTWDELRGPLAGAAALALLLAAVNLHHLVVRGQTLGKTALGIRVVRAGTDGIPGFVRLVLVRNGLGGILAHFPPYALADALWILSRDRRCLHDRLAGTAVVKTPEAQPRWTVLDRVVAGVVALCGLVPILLTVGSLLPEGGTPEGRGPVTAVAVSLAGASAEEIERLVTVPLERALTGLPEAEEVISRSGKGLAEVRIRFAPSVEAGRALEQVRDTLENAALRLPEEASPPSVRILPGEGDRLLCLTVEGDLPPAELSRMARVLLEGIERVPGVAAVETFGMLDEVLVVELGIEALQRLGIRPREALDHLRQAAIAGDPGEDLVLRAGVDGSVVRLGDGGALRETSEADGTSALLDGRPVVALVVFRGPGCDPGEIRETVLEEVRRRLEELPGEVLDLRTWDETGGDESVLAASWRQPVGLLDRNGGRLQRAVREVRGVRSTLQLVARDSPSARERGRLLALVSRDTGALRSALADTLEDDPGVGSVRVFRPGGAEEERGVTVHLLGDDLEVLSGASRAAVRGLLEVGGVRSVEADGWDRRVEMRIVPDAERMRALGIDARDLGVLVALALDGIPIRAGTGKRRAVWVRLPEPDRDPARLESLPLAAPDGALVPLGSVARLEQGTVGEILRVNGRRAIILHARLESHADPDRVRSAAREALTAILPPRYGGGAIH